MAGARQTYVVEGRSGFGPSHVLLDADDDLLAGTPWAASGFGIAPFLDPGDLAATVAWCEAELGRRAHEADGGPPELELARYHHRVATDSGHRAVVAGMRDGFAVDTLPIDVAAMEQRASELCGVAVTTRQPARRERRICVRVVRPGPNRDHNPPHRDVWIDDLRHAVNGYVPLAGSTGRSALGLIPGSHRWPESAIERTHEGARIDDTAYDVPAVVGGSEPLVLVRPDPRPGEALLFSPYLVHGAGSNEELDVTRVSLELRFWRRDRR